MRRSILLLGVLVLALATAAVLTGAAHAIHPRFRVATPAASTPPAGPPPEEVVRRFYDAANRALQTGDPAVLDDALAPDFVAHPEPTKTSAGPAWLAASLAKLRALDPTARLAPGPLLATGDRVVAHTSVVGAIAGSLANVPLAGSDVAWGPVDLFRVAGDRIAEHWTLGPDASRLEPLARAEGLALPDAPIDLGLARVSLAPGALVTGAANPGPALLAVESGIITLAIHPPGDDTAHLVLAPGDRFALRLGTRYEVRNDGPVPAVALAATAFPPASPNTAADGVELDVAEARARALLLPMRNEGIRLPLLPGVTVGLLANGPVSLSPAAAALALGRVTLDPGAELPLHDALGTTLLAIEAGTAALAPEPGRGRLAGPAATSAPAVVGEAGPTGVAARLPAGSHAAFAPGAIGPIRNVADDPLVLLVLTITPAPPATVATPSSPPRVDRPAGW